MECIVLMLGSWVSEINVPPPALFVCDAQELRAVFNDWNASARVHCREGYTVPNNTRPLL